MYNLAELIIIYVYVCTTYNILCIGIIIEMCWKCDVKYMVFSSFTFSYDDVSNSHSAQRAGSYGEAKHSHYTVHGLILPSNRTAAYKEQN